MRAAVFMEEFMKAHHPDLESRWDLDIESQGEEIGDEDWSDLEGCRLPDSSSHESEEEQ